MSQYFMLLICLFCANVVQAAPQSTVILSNQTDSFSLAPHLDILEDPQGTLSLEQVISPTYATKFTPNKQSIPNFGRTHSAYWIRFALNNQSTLKWYTRINALLGHDVNLHVLSDDGQVITDQVAHYMPNNGPHAWSLALPNQKNLQFYIRVTNGDSIISLPVELFASDDFVKQTRLDHTLYVSIIAALLMIAVYNLLSFFVLREISYLALAIHIVSVAAILQLTHPVYIGLGFLQNTDSHFFTAPIYIAVISLLVFCRHLLHTNSNIPKLDQLLGGLTFISAGLLFVTGWIPQGALLPQLMFILATALIMVASIIRSIQGDRIAKYFLSIFILIIIIAIPNTVINVFAETQWQSAKFYATGIAAILFLLLLSAVQSEKVRRWREQEQRVIASKEATDDFLMTISHELRTPMHALIGIGELLKNTPLNSSQKDYLHKQENTSQHMLGLVNDILDLGAMNRGNYIVNLAHESFYLRHILDDLKELLSVSAKKKGLTLVFSEVPSSCPPLLGDAKHLKQILINLLDNAIKYTAEGKITLNIDLQQNDHLPAMKAHFEISDTGIGIPIDKQPYLFKPFFQVNHTDQHSGTGLGLAISHHLIKQMGGELQLTTQPNIGTCFFFTLNIPIRTENKHSEITDSRKKTDVVSLKGIRILFVDDDSLNQFIGQKLLTSRGADVHLASNGREAISQIREQSYDLVLMDLRMPDMDGYETTRIIRADKNIPDCPIIALTANAMGLEREKCLNTGMDDYLAKPYDFDALVDMVLKHQQPHSITAQ